MKTPSPGKGSIRSADAPLPYRPDALNGRLEGSAFPYRKPQQRSSPLISTIVVSVAIFVAQIGVLYVLFVMGRRIVRSRIPTGSPGPITIDEGGSATIPVFAAFTGLKLASPWLALATNSLNPRLVIGPGGLEYRVLLLRTAPLDLISSIDVRTGPGTVNLCFEFCDGPFTFSANVGTEAAALQALNRLPRSVVRRPGAASLERSAQPTSPYPSLR